MKVPLRVVFASLAACSPLAAGAPELAPLPTPQASGNAIEARVRDLGDESFRVREKATREIWELGEAALPALKEAAGSASPEQAYRARDLLRKIQLHITPQTDPSVTALVERYLKAPPSEKASLFGKLKGKRAWRQMLKLYASETQDGLREKLRPAMHGVAVRAAREHLVRGDPDTAREFLEMAPADTEGLLALADFHRSHGTLEAELKRAKEAPGREAAAWRLALERAAGNLQAARDAADAAGEPQIAASMAALAGDPLPWLRETVDEEEEDALAAAYAQVAAKRWSGEAAGRKTGLEPFTRALSARSRRQKGAALNALFLLGEIRTAESAFAADEPLAAFLYFEALEKIPEALEALGLDPDHPDYQPWIRKRLTALAADEIEDQHELSSASEELVALANFLEHRGLIQQAFEAFSGPLADLAAKDAGEFTDFLRALFSGGGEQTGAPMLAKRVGIIWAGDDDRRWDELVFAAFGDDDISSAWWDWLHELVPVASRVERLDGMFALHGIGADPAGLRERWLDRAWSAVDEAPEEARGPLAGRIWDLVSQTGDVANSLKAWELLPEEKRNAVFWGQRLIQLSATENWDEAAALILGQIDALREAKQVPGAELHAYAAAALRRAGRENEAAVHDAWADKLALGSPAYAARIGNGYAYGCDYRRAGEWWARAACEADPADDQFALVLKLHADELLEQRRWKQSAAVSEVIARIYAGSEYRWSNPLPFMHQRLQADVSRALANLETERARSIATLERCHRNFISNGSLADFFFPALREAGLIEQRDRWFNETWQLMETLMRNYPGSDNTRNTAAWFAARARLKLDAAKSILEVALAANPRQAAYLDTMAELHFAMGRRDQALDWSRRAVNFAPDDSQLRRQQERFRFAPLPE